LLTAAAILLAAGLLGACGKSADEYIARARAQLDAGNIPAGIIELKNALQKEPKNLTARVLLGQSYLDMFDASDAETDLLRARDGGADPLVLAKPLAQAELLLGKFDKAVAASEFPPGASPSLKASLYSVRGLAYLAQGKAAAANEAFTAGLAEDSRSTDILAAMARYALARRDLPTARERVTAALDIAPAVPTLIALKGTVDFAEGKFPEAEDAFAKVVKAQPWNVNARTDLAQAQIAEGKLKEADANLANILKATPKALRPNYLRALTAFQAHDYKTAQSHIQTVLGTASDNLPALLLGGAISYALNQFEQANSYLGPYVNRVPQDIRGRRLLGAVQIKLGRPADAVKTLSPALAAGGNDADLLALIGEAAARSGDSVGAEKYLAQAVEKRPDSAALRTELGLSKIALGDTTAAIEEFEKAGKQDPTAIGPDTALVGTYLQNKEYDKALAVAENLQSKQPSSPLGFDLAGIAYMAKGDRASAQTALLKAKELRADDPTALRGLAALALLDGKRDVATEYYQTLASANPKDVQAAIGLAQLQNDAGKSDMASATLQKAVDQNPDDPNARVAMARLLLFQGKGRDALASVEGALAKNPRDPGLLEVTGQAQLALGQRDAAIATFRGLVDAAPQSSDAHRELALAYSVAGDFDKAEAEARTALALRTEDKAAKLVLGSTLISAKKLDEARKLADDWAGAAPQDADFAELQGIVASAQDRNQDALAAFQRGVSVLDNNVTRTRLAFAQEKAGRQDEAEKTLSSWLETHPDDLAARRALAQIYLGAKKNAEARDEYAEILRQAPNDVASENNLAWLMSTLGQKDEALDHARHAAAAAPDAPNVLDTLGVILLEKGSAAEARDALEKAAKAAPTVAEIQFHLAQALEATGEADRAREILRGLLSRNDPFEGRDQAQQLLNQLRG
jgi:putative PEP-CTERM system TPR-repeat lipoprotein